MKKNGIELYKRKEFVNKAINNPKEAAKILLRKAKGLENCRNTSDSIYALQDILFLSERTIWNDYKN